MKSTQKKDRIESLKKENVLKTKGNVSLSRTLPLSRTKRTKKSIKNTNTSFSSFDGLNRPRTLICFLCGRNYGLSSLRIHIRSCIKVYEQLIRKLPKRFHKHPIPRGPNIKRPTSLIQSAEIIRYNEIAFDIFQERSRIKCPGCDLRLSAHVLVNHVKKCEKYVKKSEKRKKKKKVGVKPKMVECVLCNRMYGKSSIKIHMNSCFKLRKLKKKNKKKKPHFNNSSMPNFRLIMRECDRKKQKEVEEENSVEDEGELEHISLVIKKVEKKNEILEDDKDELEHINVVIRKKEEGVSIDESPKDKTTKSNRFNLILKNEDERKLLNKKRIRNNEEFKKNEK